MITDPERMLESHARRRRLLANQGAVAAASDRGGPSVRRDTKPGPPKPEPTSVDADELGHRFLEEATEAPGKGDEGTLPPEAELPAADEVDERQ